MLAAKHHAALASRLRPVCTSAVPLSAHFLLQLAHAYLELADPAGARTVLRQVRDILRLRPELGTVARQADRRLEQMLDTIRVGAVGASSLTAAELRLLPLLATHLSYRDIGERLFLSRNTVKSEAVSLFPEARCLLTRRCRDQGRGDRAPGSVALPPRRRLHPGVDFIPAG